ncbi:MAG: patatin-like phospholipase family protein, partial [Pseudobdellovibrio sp.]
VQTTSHNLAWKESRRVAKHVEVNERHVMASSAIPMLFPPIQIDNQYYGDGCVRNATPCSPSIRLGAEKLFVIGVRTQLHAPVIQENEELTPKSPSFVRIINTLLNAVLLDSVEQDVHRIQKINQLASLLPESQRNADFKNIPAICISPSQDIGQLARNHAHHLPRLIRMTLSTFGSLDEASEILSYLLFEPHFCRKLLDMGYNDAMASKKEILEFFNS